MNSMKEIWSPIKGFEGIYEVSNLGYVKSNSRVVAKESGVKQTVNERTLKLVINKVGYPKVGLYKGGVAKIVSVHRLVASAFIPNPENKKEVNHKNGNRRDNRVDNLEWVSPSENIRHSFNVLLRKASGPTRETSRWFGVTGKDHPTYGSTHMIGRSGALSSRSKKVKCDTLDIVFYSGCIAAKRLGINQSRISAVCLGKIKHTNGFSFKYVN